jgi:hypothetical protein
MYIRGLVLPLFVFFSFFMQHLVLSLQYNLAPSLCLSLSIILCPQAQVQPCYLALP